MIFLFLNIINAIFFYEKTGNGFMYIKDVNVGLGPVEKATDFIVTNCSTPPFSLNLRDNESMASLDMSGENKELVALNQNTKTEQCFKLVLTPKNDFVIMHAGKCLRYDKENKKFYHEYCNKSPTHFNLLFETSIMHGEDLPPNEKKKYSPYTRFIQKKNKNKPKKLFSKKNI